MSAARPPIAEGLPHTSEREPGRTAYSTDGCRCDECREANAAYYRGRRGGLSAAAFAPKSETEEWKAEGACRDHDPDLFFPDRGEDTDTAKRICAGCTVRRECLTYALTAPRERNGIWGGTSGRERRNLTLASIEGRPLPPIVYTHEALAATRARQSAAAKARQPLSAWLDALREHPGKWAKWDEPLSNGIATNIRQGKRSGIEAGEFEVRTVGLHRPDRRVTIYARYVGTPDLRAVEAS